MPSLIGTAESSRRHGFMAAQAGVFRTFNQVLPSGSSAVSGGLLLVRSVRKEDFAAVAQAQMCATIQSRIPSRTSFFMTSPSRSWNAPW